MPIQPPKSASSYQSEILAALAVTGIKQTAPGGKARAFCDIVGQKIGESEANFLAAIAQRLVPYASSDNLDFLGEMYGVERIPRLDSRSLAADANFQFYVARGTFGSINNGQDIIVPAGTRIFKDSSTSVIYVTTSTTLLPADGVSATFSATSLTSGEMGNAPAGVFTRHNFTGYTDSDFGSLLVTNNYGLTGGRDEEDDDSYRYRINLRLQSRGGAAEADLRLAILSVPGVQDVVFERLSGTFYCYVYGISPVVAPSVLQMVQSAIDDRIYPLSGIVLAPDLVGISLTATLKFATTSSTADRSSAANAAQAAAADYINNLGVGETLVFNEIADRIRSADPRIVDVGEPNKQLGEVFLWRSRADGSRYSRYLVNDYTPVTGERIVVEAQPNAINLITA